jgi:hypothetical protein
MKKVVEAATDIEAGTMIEKAGIIKRENTKNTSMEGSMYIRKKIKKGRDTIKRAVNGTNTHRLQRIGEVIAEIVILLKRDIGVEVGSL